MAPDSARIPIYNVINEMKSIPGAETKLHTREKEFNEVLHSHFVSSPSAAATDRKNIMFFSVEF